MIMQTQRLPECQWAVELSVPGSQYKTGDRDTDSLLMSVQSRTVGVPMMHCSQHTCNCHPL